MEWLNYHHLHYFWTVAREGSVTAASESLRLSPSTVSAQIKRLEAQLGHALFRRQGRGLVLTDVGRVAFDYAEDIFGLGRELLSSLRLETPGRVMRLRVGVAHVLPKLVSRRILEAAIAMSDTVQLVCREDRTENLLAELALHHLDLVLSDTPRPPNLGVQVFNHFLGECDVLVFATPQLAGRTIAGGFPASLDGAPFLLPTHDTAIRRAIDHWFEVHHVSPWIVGEFDDSALMKSFGGGGHGFFPAPAIIADEIARQHGVMPVGRLVGVTDRFYAISEERRIRHPAVAAIAQGAERALFGLGDSE